MKKSLLFLPLVMMSLAGCDPVVEEYGDLLDIEVASGLQEEYVQYTVVDLNEVSVTATFENKTITINGANLTFTPTTLNTSELGEFDITVAYETESIVWTYTIVQYDEITNIGAPEFVTNYTANIATKSAENKRNEFKDLKQGYFVGDDNPFIFFPTIYAYDSEGEEMNVTAYHSSSVVKEKRGDEWVTLTGAELDAAVAIDEFASSYDFAEAAIGKTYSLSVRPAGDEYATAPKFETSFIFTIANGYNVYKQDDLSHFDNINVNIWNSYRTAKGITQVDIDGLFFHNDIKIERDKLPDGFFYMEGDSDAPTDGADYPRIIGSLRDDVGVYYRDILPSEDFVINGNYFNLDYSSLPVVVREAKDSVESPTEEGKVISHATVIKAGNAQTGDDLGDYELKNLSVVGNANRTEEAVKSGGAIFSKTLSVDSLVYNVIATQCFTIFLTEFSGPNATIEKTRGYDSFSSMLYNFGTTNLLIKDCEFIGAGGPVLISDHVYADEVTGEGGYQPQTLVQNSLLESYVTGDENWFRLVSATGAAAQLVALGTQLLPYYGSKSIVKMITVTGKPDPIAHFNMIGLIKDGGVAEPTSAKVNGKIQIDENVALDFKGAFMTSASGFGPEYARFQSSDGPAALLNPNPQGLISVGGVPIATKYEPGAPANYFTGDYMNVYYNIGSGTGFMGMVFGLVEFNG
ncbi:MAG: hypothetical protein WC344_00505 [Bacilli bacterium]|jgi:hypothetical protein